MKSIQYSIGKIGFSLYIRNLWKYKYLFLIPGLALNFINNNFSKSIDFEFSILSVGIGLRLFIKK